MIDVGYVGYGSVASEKELRHLLGSTNPTASEISNEQFFFLRSLHQVSGIVTPSDLPDQLSPEGQMFSAQAELRWKKSAQGYDLLWLGQQQPADETAFTSIKGEWQIEDKTAILHDRKTPQFPKLFRYPKGLKKRLGQRYFRDGNTSIVHFIALTIMLPKTTNDK